MKKLLLAVLLAACVLPAYAGIDEGIDKGMTHVFVLGGAAFPTMQLEDSAGNKFDYGGTAFTYGAQIMHYLTPGFGLGIEYNGANYPTATTGIQDIKSSRNSFFLAGKISFAPASKTRFYIPLGAGMSMVENDIANFTKEKYTKPSFYAGVGIENDLNDIFVMGFEARYNLFMIDKDKLAANNDFLSDVSALLKIGIKF